MSEGLSKTRESLEKAAADLGLIPLFPDYLTLTVDIDAPKGTPNMRVYKALEENGILYPWDYVNQLRTVSKGGNTHWYIRVTKHLATSQRIALQASLGSDPVRESLNCLRDYEDAEESMVLFETEEEFQRVTEWLDFVRGMNSHVFVMDADNLL